MAIWRKDPDEVAATYSPEKRQRMARLKKYREQVRVSTAWRRDEHDDLWRELIDLYRNRTLDQNERTDYADSVSLAVGFSTVNVIYPSVSLSRPKITLTATKPSLVEAATITEAVVNHWWKHYDYQTEFRQAVKDFLILGHGWVKTTYVKKEEDVELSEDERQGELIEALKEKFLAVQASPEDEALFPSNQEIADTIPTVRKVVTEDHPNVERVSPFDVLVDPDATRDYDMRWIAQRIAVPKAEARLKKHWNQNVLSDLIDSAKELKEGDGYYDDQIGKDETYIIVYEHYDLSTGYLCTFADQGDDFLEDPKPTPFPFLHPFVMLRNYEVPEHFYPIGELEMIDPLVEAMSRILTRQLGDIGQFTRKFGTKEGWVDDKAINALKSTADGEVVTFTDAAPDDLRQALVALPTMTPDASMYQMNDVLVDHTTRVSAVNEYMQGALPEIRRTATEAGIIADASNARAAEKLAQIELNVANVARRVVQLGQKMLTEEQVALMYEEDPNNPTEWVPFSREDIQGEYSFEVEAGSTQPRNETFRRQSALQMMDAFANPLFAPQPQPDGTVMPIIDARKLAEYVMREGFGVRNASEFIIPEPPPLPPVMMDGELPPGEEGMPPEGGMPPPQALPPGPMPPMGDATAGAPPVA